MEFLIWHIILAPASVLFPFARSCHQVLVPSFPGVSLIDHQAVPLHCARYKEGPTTWVLSCHVPYTGGISFQPQFNAGADLPT